MKIYLIGMGMGGGGTLTADGRRAIAEAETLIGAPRMLETEEARESAKPKLASYSPQDIAEYLSRGGYGCAAVLLSGDASFYSGAKRLAAGLEGHDVKIVPGISSFSYMCALTGASIEDTEAVSLHGRDGSVVCRVRDNRRTFVLPGRPEDAGRICAELARYGMDCCTVYIGSRLGYSDERLIKLHPSEYKSRAAAPAALMIENPHPKRLLGRHIRDGEFIRGGVPMTKDAVRALSAAALDPPPGGVIYDIGAGTGSVAVELSLRSHDVMVYAVERDTEAAELIRANRRKFCADNIRVAEGEAPAALEPLPPPDCAFIGGSGGNMDGIIEAVLKKNQRAVIVVNTVTLNSASALMRAAERLGLEISASLINAAHSKKAGGSLMMLGENPVYIFRLWRDCDGE